MGIFNKPSKVDDTFIKLRNLALSLDPAQIGVSPDKTKPIFGILMETRDEDDIITLSAIADGSVSLYFSNGGGIIGLGEHEGPRKACFSFLSYANQFISHLRPANKFPFPLKGNTSFYFLTINGVLTLSAKEADLGNNKHPLSPLFYKGHEVITQARLVDEKRRRNISEFINGATMGDMQNINGLLEEHVNPNVSDPTGLTPLMAASHSGKVEILEILLKAGALIDTKDSSGYTALMFSCNSGQLSCARFLIEKGANVNEVANDGSTPIMFSAQHGHNNIVRYLLEKGADPRLKGKHGLSAIGFADQNGLVETKKILEGTM